MSDKSEFETVHLATRFRGAENMRGIYAHHMTIQPIEHEIALSFFELRPPLVYGTSEEIEQQIAKVAETGIIDADCVARILVSKGKFMQFVKAMNDFVASVRADIARKEAESAGGSGDSPAENGDDTEG